MSDYKKQVALIYVDGALVGCLEVKTINDKATYDALVQEAKTGYNKLIAKQKNDENNFITGYKDFKTSVIDKVNTLAKAVKEQIK